MAYAWAIVLLTAVLHKGKAESVQQHPGTKTTINAADDNCKKEQSAAVYVRIRAKLRRAGSGALMLLQTSRHLQGAFKL